MKSLCLPVTKLRMAVQNAENGVVCIGADFRFEVPGQSSVGLIGGGRGQWLGGTMASAEHEPIMGVWGRSPLKLKAFWSLDVQRSRQI